MSLTTIKLPEFKPPKGSGLEQLGRLLENAYEKNKPALMNLVNSQRINFKDPLETIKGSVQTLSKNLNNTLGLLTSKSETIDYMAVVRSFTAKDARLLKPGYPKNAQEVLQADLDGDGRDELIATFRTNEGLRTLILKSRDKNWYKAAEIYHNAHENINYRNAVSLTGENKKHLLIGLTGNGNENMLYGYSLSDDTAVRLFNRNYNWVELVRKPKNASRSKGETLSVWNRTDDGNFDIEVLNWAGSQLEPANDDQYYYRTRVAPYYLNKARRNPSDTNSWYRLAKALVKAGAGRDAMIVADAGSRQDKDPQLKEKFISLKKEISEKYL